MIKISLIFLILFSLWVTRDLFRPEFCRSHDALYNIVRLDQFHRALISGQFPVRWAPDLLNGLGYPLFVVNYHLPYYLAETFHLLSLSLFAAIKAVFILSLVASALTSFWLFYAWTKKPSAAVLGTVFYILAPYRLANIFERGALGEAVAYAFVPLVFLGLDRLKQNKSHLLIFALSMLTLSHTVVLLTFAPIFLAYSILFVKPKLKFLFLFGLTIFGFTAFQMFPVLFERHYLKFDANLLTAYQGHFKSLYQLLRLPAAGVNIGTRFQIGLVPLLVLILACFRIKKFWFWIGSSILAVFLVTPWSQWLWDNLSVLPWILYPWRFLGVVAFATAALAALMRPKFLVICILLLVAWYSTRHYTKVDAFIPPIFPQEMLAGNATTQNEFDPISPHKLASPGRETPVRQAGNWLSLATATFWLTCLLRLPIHAALRRLST